MISKNSHDHSLHQQVDHSDPLLHPHTTSSSIASTHKDGTSVQSNEIPMGGKIGSIVSSVMQEEASDTFAPGRNASYSGMSNITIQSDLVAKNPSNGVQTKERSNNILSNLLQPTSSTDPIKIGAGITPAMDAHIRSLHQMYKRRFQNRPSNQESKHYNINPEPCKAKYQVTKLRSWRVGYNRIVSFHATYFTTLDPESREITNLWYYNQVRHYMALPNEPDCMLIEVMDNGLSIKLKLKCQPGERNEALTDFVQWKYWDDVRVRGDLIQREQHSFFEHCHRQKRDGSKVSTSLLCAPFAILEMDTQSERVLRTFLFRCIRAISFLNDDSDGVVLHLNETNHSMDILDQQVFYIQSKRIGGSGRSDFITIMKNKFELLNMKWTVAESTSLESVLSGKALKNSIRTVGECISSHLVKRISSLDPCGSSQRLLLSQKGFILERKDIKGIPPAQKISLKSGSLYDVANIVRHSPLFPPLINTSSIDCNKCFSLEYKSGLTRTYMSENRDAVIVSLLDVAIYTCKNFNVTVTHVPSQSYQIKSYVEVPEDVSQNINLFVSEPCELQCLRILHEVASVSESLLQLLSSEDVIGLRRYVNECYALVEMCHEFNANVRLESTTLLPNDEKLIVGTISSLWRVVSILAAIYLDEIGSHEHETHLDFTLHSFHAQVCSILQCQYRLMITPKGYETTAQDDNAKRLFYDLWKFHDPFVQYWFLKTLSALLLPLPFSTSRNIESESMNKQYLLVPEISISSGIISYTLNFKYDQNSALLLMVVSNILESILCSHHDSTKSDQFARMVDVLASDAVRLLSLLDFSNSVVSENIVLLLQVISNYSQTSSELLREISLTSGLLLKHFYLAIYGLDEGQRFLSRFLCSLWFSGPSESAQKQLLKRIVPSGFLTYLEMPSLSSREEEDLDIVDGFQGDYDAFNGSSCIFDGSGVNKVRFRTKLALAKKIRNQRKPRNTEENFRIFFHMLTQDHSLPDLIWNEDTRSEFKKDVEQTLEAIRLETSKRGSIEELAWNHQQFAVQYISLQNETQVGPMYLRLWLDTNESYVKSLKDPLRFFEALYRRMLYDMDKNTKVVSMCIQSIERLYVVHSKEIGVFPDLPRIMHMVTRATSKEIRDCFLSLLEVVVGIREQAQERLYMVANIEQLLNPDCMKCLCSMVMEDHKNIKSSIFGLRCLTQLALVHKDVNINGVPFFPIPIAKSLLCDASAGALPILCRVMLTDDGRLVERAAILINHLMRHNDSSCRSLYLTGVFYFILRSNIENWEPLAQLLYDTHLRQDVPCFPADTTMELRSVLNNLLPIGLLKVLIRHGPKRFAKIFVSDYDTPEVIWNPGLRNHLATLIEEHINDFLMLWKKDNTTTYNFLLMPSVSYDGLDDALFCHNYYLCNLCNENKYPDFSVEEPKLFFMECIETWKRLLGRSNQDYHKSVDEAFLFFGLGTSNNAKDLRVAYRNRMSAVDVTDNKKVKEILEFYETLSPILSETSSLTLSAPMDGFHSMASFTERDAVGLHMNKDCLYPTWLLMKAQLLVCKKYPSCIEQTNYPAYDSILLCLELPTLCNDWDIIMERGRARLVRIATELLFYTCLVSPSNAEALVKAGGVHSLAHLMSCCRSTINKVQLEEDSDPDAIQLLMETLTYAVKTLSGVAYFPSGLKTIESLPDLSKFCSDWCSCINFNFLRYSTYGCNLLRRFALEGIASLSKSTLLQNHLYERGAVWNLIHVMMDFDENFTVTSVPDEVFRDKISQSEVNYHAALASRALGMLCGVMKEELSTPMNYKLFAAVKKILTVPIANMLQNSDSNQILRTLSLQLETPLLLWDMKMRSELSAFIYEMELKQNKGPEFFDNLIGNDEFVYSNLADEVNIGGVYIRIFTHMDEQLSTKGIPDCLTFAKSLIEYLGRCLLNDGIEVHTVVKDIALKKEYQIHGGDDNYCAVDDERFYMVVQSLARLVNMEGTVDKVLCERGSPSVLVSFIALPLSNRALSAMIDILLQISTKQAFANSIIQEPGLLPWVLSRLEYPANSEENVSLGDQISYKIWNFVENLAMSSMFASYMIASSGWFELLALATNSHRFQPSMATREGAAKTLARLLFDANSSAAIGALLRKLLPAPLVIELKENGAAAMLQSFDSNSDTPEFIWDDSMRIELDETMSSFLDSIMDEQGHRIIAKNQFSLPSGFELKYSRLENETAVAGLYLEHFLGDPSYSLRDPIGSLEGVLVQYFQFMESCTNNIFVHSLQVTSDGDKTYNKMSLVTKTIIALCTVHPFLNSKLSLWTYTRQLVFFLHKCVSVEQLGQPLLFTIKLILLSAHDMENVEDMCEMADENGKGGIVDGIIRAINGNPLHPESDIMIECLVEVFRLALGDLETCNFMSPTNGVVSNTIAGAPSPAPTGSNSVSKMKRVNVGDDPLAMIAGSVPFSTSQTLMATQASKVIRKRADNRNVDEREHSSVSTECGNTEINQLKCKNSHNIGISNESYQDPSLPSVAPGGTRHAIRTPEGNILEPNYLQHKHQNPPQFSLPNTSDITGLSSNQNYEELNVSQRMHPPSQHTLSMINSCNQNASKVFSQQTSSVLKDTELYGDLKHSTRIFSDSSRNNEGGPHVAIDPHQIAEEKRKHVPGAKGSAKNRAVLLDSAVKCRLPSFIVLNILDNEVWKGVMNPTRTRFYAISLLNLLLKDPGYGSTFKLMLDECPTWAKHRKSCDSASNSDSKN